MRSAGVLAALAAVAAAAPARAAPDGRERAPGETVAVLDIDTEGISGGAADEFASSLLEGLRGAGVEAVPQAELSRRLVSTGYTDGCVFGPCVRAVYDATGIRLALSARVQGAGSTYSFVVTLVDARTGQPTSQVADRCTVCTVQEAISTATVAVVELVTGTGGADVLDPEAGPTGSSGAGAGPAGGADPAYADDGGRARRIGLALLGAAALGGIAGGALWATDDTDLALPVFAAGGAFAVSGAVSLSF